MQQRLNLLYPKRHALAVSDSNNRYSVRLDLQLDARRVEAGALRDASHSALRDGSHSALRDGEAGALRDGEAGALRDGEAGALRDGEARALRHV